MMVFMVLPMLYIGKVVSGAVCAWYCVGDDVMRDVGIGCICGVGDDAHNKHKQSKRIQ